MTTPIPTPEQAKLRLNVVTGMVKDCVDNPERCIGEVAGTVLTGAVAAQVKSLALSAKSARAANQIARAEALAARAEIVLEEEALTVAQPLKPSLTTVEDSALQKAMSQGRVKATAPKNHLNGAMAEERWWASDIQNGEIALNEPCIVNQGGIDYATYNPTDDFLYMNDAKYRSGNYWPSAITPKQKAAWTADLKELIDNYPAGPVKTKMQAAFANGDFGGRIRKYGTSGFVGS